MCTGVDENADTQTVFIAWQISSQCVCVCVTCVCVCVYVCVCVCVVIISIRQSFLYVPMADMGSVEAHC